MRYFFDTEFIEDGYTIDLISIGIVAEDGRELYLQRPNAGFAKASDWVARYVFPYLVHFDMAKQTRMCKPSPQSMSIYTLDGRCSKDCPWKDPHYFRTAIKDFINPNEYGKPEFWAYYASYDWVALCQVFGRMIDLPEGWPMYCNDIKQLCNAVGDPALPEQKEIEHHALADARWNKQTYEFLRSK